MEKCISILLYEKEKHLNSILHQQILNTKNYDSLATDDQMKLFEALDIKDFDICILNLDDLKMELICFLDRFLEKNETADIIGYYNKSINNEVLNNFKIYLLKKPFRINTLLKKIDKLQLIKNKNNKKFLMKHIEFSPNKKIISNLNTKDTLHLTEKENQLLNFLSNKRNLELTKKDLLTNIWGVTESINTHTLETHIYRLKQKLYKLDPHLSFSLINHKGLYSINITEIS